MIYKLFLIIVINSTDYAAMPKGDFESFSECFDARDELLVKYKDYDGYFGKGMQAVCIPYIK